MADIDRTGGMMVVLFIARRHQVLRMVKDPDLEIICSLRDLPFLTAFRTCKVTSLHTALPARPQAASVRQELAARELAALGSRARSGGEASRNRKNFPVIYSSPVRWSSRSTT